MKKYRKFKVFCAECGVVWEWTPYKKMTQEEAEALNIGCSCCESVDIIATGIE
jgi:hypothetical protein